MAAEPILAIDVGADSIKVAEFSYPGADSIVLEDFTFSEYGGDMDEVQMLDALYATFQSILSENRFRAKRVHLCISGQLTFTKFVKLPPITNPEQIKQIVEFEAKQNLPFPMDEIIWDYQLVNDDEVLFVVVKREIIERITNIIEASGRQTVLVDVAPTAGYNAARMNGISMDECSMLLNIGGRCATLLFIDENRFYVRSIAIAGHYITEQIAKEFNINYRDAEDMKRRFGFVSLGGAYEEPESEVAATVSKIVRNAMTRLHGEINRSINVYRAQQGGRRPEKLYLAGGSSVMAYTPRFFSEKLRMPVEYLNPFQVVSVSPNIDKNELSDVAHLFSDVIGIGMRGVSTCPLEISLVPESLKKVHEMKARKPFLYASAATLVLCAGVIYFGLALQAKTMAEYPKQFTSLINSKKELTADIEKAKEDMDAKVADYKRITQKMTTRTEWINLLNGVQNLLPDNAWIVSMALDKPVAAAPSSGGLFGGLGGLGVSNNESSDEDSESPKPEKVPEEWLSLSVYVLCTVSDPNGQKAWTTLEERVKKAKEDPAQLFDAIKAEKSLIYTKPTPNAVGQAGAALNENDPKRGMNNLSFYQIKLKLKNPLSAE